jgi:tetratricopeptide (TPR) repeat protein
LQALYKQGRTLEALKRVDEALVIHQKIIEMYMNQKNTLSTDADVWFVRAVTDAAQAFEQLKDYRAAVRIYSHLAQTNLPQAAEARRRIRELRDTHNLLQFQGEQP